MFAAHPLFEPRVWTGHWFCDRLTLIFLYVPHCIRGIAEGRTPEYFETPITKEITFLKNDGNGWVADGEPVRTAITETPDAIALTLPYFTAPKTGLAVYRYHTGEGACAFGEEANPPRGLPRNIHPKEGNRHV